MKLHAKKETTEGGKKQAKVLQSLQKEPDFGLQPRELWECLFHATYFVSFVMAAPGNTQNPLVLFSLLLTEERLYSTWGWHSGRVMGCDKQAAKTTALRSGTWCGALGWEEHCHFPHSTSPLAAEQMTWAVPLMYKRARLPIRLFPVLLKSKRMSNCTVNGKTVLALKHQEEKGLHWSPQPSDTILM